jgi:hypothetical protein
MRNVRDHTKRLLSKKFDKALTVLNQQYTNSEVRGKLNEKLTSKIKESIFSKMKLAHKRKNYLNDVHEKNYFQIFEILEPIIENEFHVVWDDKSEEFKKMIDDTNNPRLQGLVGVWIGYSWDVTMTSNTGKDFIHIFKVNVAAINDIICVAQRATFTGNKIVLINTDRVAIEMTSAYRKIFLIIHIGNAELEDLKKEKMFYLAYADSGNKRVKSGLAVMQRTDRNFEDIIPESKEVIHIEDPHLAQFLTNTQLIVEL